jgi:Protein NO VEIN, C-terminal
VDLLTRNGLDRRTEIQALRSPLQATNSREVLLRELELLLGRAPEESRRMSEAIGRVALAPGADGAVWPWAQTFRADQQTRNLFEPFADDSVFLDEDQLPSDAVRLAALSPSFRAPDAISSLAAQGHEAITQRLEDDEVDVAALLEWFEIHKSQFIDEPSLVSQLAELPLFPTRTSFRPLSELALPGDFVDELGLADIIDVERVGDALPLLKRLGARPLTFASYVTEFVPRAADLSISDPERWWKLVLLIAEKLGEIEDDGEVQRVLADLPCVRTSDGGFEKPSSVYFASHVVTKILGEYPSAFLPRVHPRSVEAFYTWIGVATKPRTRDVLEQIRGLSAVAPTESASTVVTNVVEYLAIELTSKRRQDWGELGMLAGIKWLPARGDSTRWYGPQEVYTTFQDYLFLSQARFISVPVPVQRGAAAFMEELGVRTTPSTDQIVSHLLQCSASGDSVNQQVYAVLNQRVEDPEIDRLRERRSILLPSGSWVSPAFVFWGGHPFGRFRASLGTDFQRFAPLLSRLGVREHPNYEDAAAVLLEMANEFGRTNSPIEDEDDVRVYTSCWRMLDEALDAEDVLSAWFGQFRARKVVRDPRGVLIVPDRIFFDDVPGLADLFPQELRSYLIRRPEGAWRAMRAAGVRDLSRAVTTRMLELGERETNEGLRSIIRDRVWQIGRVLDPFDPTWLSHVGDSIAALKVVSATQLTVAYSLEAFRMTAPAADLEALFVPEDAALYVSRTGEQTWLAVARELARAIAPDTPPGSLAANLALVLSAPSGEAADRQLDQAWVPRLAHSLEGTAVASVVEAFGGEEAPTADREEVSSPEEAGGALDRAEVGVTSGQPPRDRLAADGSVSESASEIATSSAASSDGQTASDQPRAEGPRSRLRSYVIPAGDPAASSVEGGVDRDGDSAVDRAGIDRVLSFERDSGRTPVEKPHAFPGYDIESMGADGSVERYIEVKSLSGPWDSYGVSVSPRQLAEARRRGDSYWLYVVARAQRPDFNIYFIQNPASKVDQFMFDDAWIGVGETSVAGRPIPPVHLIDADARPPDRTYLPFYDIPSQEPGSAGAEAGWAEWDSDALPGCYLVQVLGDALEPTAHRGSLVVVEPLNAEAPEAGDPVLLDLGGQTDPETGTDLAFRIWPAEDREGDPGSFELLSLSSAVPPLVVQDADLVRVLGRLRLESKPPATGGHG